MICSECSGKNVTDILVSSFLTEDLQKCFQLFFLFIFLILEFKKSIF